MEIIGVHCTHGYNRTGFLIIAYLVEKEDWDLEAAISVFAKVDSNSSTKNALVLCYCRPAPLGYTKNTTYRSWPIGIIVEL